MPKLACRILVINDEQLVLREFVKGLNAAARALDNPLGISFTGEMGVKGAYEKTIGKLTEWIRGRKPTPEDIFAHKAADDYAAFLRQTPWYEFPFGKTLARFWRETSWSSPSYIRSIERRLALSVEHVERAAQRFPLGLETALPFFSRAQRLGAPLRRPLQA